jgi:hypothetical protein
MRFLGDYYFVLNVNLLTDTLHFPSFYLMRNTLKINEMLNIIHLIGSNHKNTAIIHMDETVPSTTKMLPVDHKQSRESSINSNNLLKPETNLWNMNDKDVELMRNKSQSISNIAGKSIQNEIVLFLL